MRDPLLKKLFAKGVTLLELLVVVMIIAILSTIAVGVYTREVTRARVAKARAEIRALEIAINRYQIDTGQYPPSSTGTSFSPNPLDPFDPATTPNQPNLGNGYLRLALQNSLNADPRDPLSARWNGPYMDWDYNRLGDIFGNTTLDPSLSPAQIMFLDPWGNPYHYIRSSPAGESQVDYVTFGGTELPLDHPLSSVESYYNPSTFQLVSFGPNGRTEAAPYVGTEPDDVTNWDSPEDF